MYLLRFSVSALLTFATLASALDVLFFPDQPEVCNINGVSHLECRGLSPRTCCGPVLPPYGTGIAYNGTTNDRNLGFAAYSGDSCFRSPSVAQFSCGGTSSGGSCCTQLGFGGKLSVYVDVVQTMTLSNCQREAHPNVLVYVDDKDAEHEIYLANENDQQAAIKYLEAKDFGQLANFTTWSGQNYPELDCKGR